MLPHFHTSSVCILSGYFLYVTPSCLCPPAASENLFVGSVVVLSSHIIQLILCLGLIIVQNFFIVCCLFIYLMVYWHVVCLQQFKTNSPSPLYVQSSLGSIGFAHWLSGQSGELVVQSFLILSNFSAFPGAALKFRYQSIVKESESKNQLVQKVMVLLWVKVQYGVVSPLMWAWTWRTQRRSGHGWHLSCWM